jgi:hypothetical protein
MFRTSRATTAVAAAAGLGAVAAVAQGDEQPPLPEPPDDQRGIGARLAPAPRALAARLPHLRVREQRPPGRYTILRVRRGKTAKLRAKPGGRTLTRLADRTEFGSSQTLTVVRRHGRWAGVTTSRRPNGRLAWVDESSDAFERDRTRVSLRVDLSRRVMTFRQGGFKRSVRVRTGGPLSPTPTGRFAITDKLAGARYNSVYGCCILALSGHQERTPPGWRGADRLAIHCSTAPRRFTGSTAGCVRAESSALRMLMRNVPLGTPFFVHE